MLIKDLELYVSVLFLKYFWMILTKYEELLSLVAPCTAKESKFNIRDELQSEPKQRWTNN